LNLAVLLFFTGASVELAYLSVYGEDAYLGQLQHVYDTFVSKDPRLRAQFASTPPYQRLEILRGVGFVQGGIVLSREENPHSVDIRPRGAARRARKG
jgi:hypothetical protein